jgi:cytochrome c553
VFRRISAVNFPSSTRFSKAYMGLCFEMKSMRYQLGFVTLLGALVCAALGQVLTQPLAWDATSKHYDAKRGETNAFFIFNLTNVSFSPIVVNAVRPSCGCTTPKLPPLPWQIAPGANGQMEIQVDLRGRQGLLRKTISIETSDGTNVVTINVQIPEPDPREKNRLVAFTDRQAVFKADCANCHLHPAAGKQREALFKAACGICHEAEHRAEMVPDLAALKKPTDAKYWEQWVRLGKPGTFMPAFSKPYGGPWDDAQIASIVTYLAERFASGSPP